MASQKIDDLPACPHPVMQRRSTKIVEVIVVTYTIGISYASPEVGKLRFCTCQAKGGDNTVAVVIPYLRVWGWA
jgi:hypothetical protein